MITPPKNEKQIIKTNLMISFCSLRDLLYVCNTKLRRMKDYLYYLFDFDLTLADSSKGIVMCFTNVLHRHGYEQVTEMEIKRTIGKTLEDSFTILTGVNNPEQLAAWKLEYTREADKYMNDNTVLFPETIEVLTKLKVLGCKIAIISTKYRYRIEGVMERYFPKGFIDVIIGGEDVKHAKPHPQGVKAALKKLKAKKELALYIGDSTVDAETARNTGIDFCGVLNGLTTREELAAYPHRQILNDLTLLPLLQKKGKHKKTWLPKRWEAKRRAYFIRQIRGLQEKPLENKQAHICQNCGDRYAGDYCPSCGQAAKTGRITLKSAFSNLFSSFFSIESGFLGTCYELIYRPGYMVKDFIQGKRSRYYKPFSLLLVMAALYLIAGHLLVPSSLGNSKEVKDNLENRLDSVFSEIVVVQEDSLEIKEDMVVTNEPKVQSLMDKMEDWYNEQMHEGTFLYALKDLLTGWFADNQAFLFIAIMPFYIFATKKVFRQTRTNQLLNVSEYVFIYGYFGSQIIMKDIVLLPFTGIVEAKSISSNIPFLGSTTIEFLLMMRNFKQLFNLGWWKAFKSTLKTFICLTLLFIGLVAIIALVIATLIVAFT